MVQQSSRALDDLARASARLSQERRLTGLVSVFVEQALDLTASDLAALYLYAKPEEPEAGLALFYRRGVAGAPDRIGGDDECAAFLRECDDSLVISSPGDPYFSSLLLVPGMASGVGLPLSTARSQLGFLVLNSRQPSYFDHGRFHFLDSFRKMAGNMLQNARLNDELRDRLAEIALLERYQASVFSSMTNLLVTTDKEGRIRYCNSVARERLSLDDGAVGRSLAEVLGPFLAPSVLKSVASALAGNTEILGIEGIYQREDRSIDFSLNLSPLRSRRGLLEGLILLFTDQTAERALKDQVEVVVEERRVIKDMFARYLSHDVVETLMLHPELVKPGGDKKNATVFFGDIRGYTSFSENKPPEYIIEVLNAYFSEAVEIIIKHRGFIDKFIGDAIMAAWGVPMQSEETDAIEAVSSALEIQELIRSKGRTFFMGEASKLQVGIGLHTGPLVAGNLGSARRLNYSVIGDTVNVAARLEGVAKGGEVIITQDTRERIGDHFKLKELAAVTVKGKSQPIHVFSVLALR
ncbi:MAG TPA: adenylate/guanylate cyclase domain-containing protein [Rectinemataceae bacterium]|nr:adenylate/guanylate cyclase domain-containing protein [Rectinemataceae bacterium]